MRFKGAAIPAEWPLFQGRYYWARPRAARGAGGSIHGTRRGSPDASNTKFCHGDCDRSIDIMRQANDLGYWCLLLKDSTGATDMGNHDAAIKMIKVQVVCSAGCPTANACTRD